MQQGGAPEPEREAFLSLFSLLSFVVSFFGCLAPTPLLTKCCLGLDRDPR